ncbi:hypothetical protein C8F04DRAFT_1192625 [Mycena alexandri]|uniref:Uncharacterized protein n=1 Tax=Mycena alexandri TaxID=1745969 RepID=A0AAD6SDM5_9AGAR|nr:hypothetical protein C8F04DRAFT_1192625 [Mycena alexandri]
MSALPHFPGASLDHGGQGLWPTILSAEQAALDVSPAAKTNPKHLYTSDRLIGIRVLGFLLLDLYEHRQLSFGAVPYNALIREITSCLSPLGSKGEKLQNLGLQYRNRILRVFRSSSNNSIPIEDSESDPPHVSDPLTQA